MPFVSLEEPMDAKSVGEMPINAKRHVAQVVEECFVRSLGKFVEDGSQFDVLPAVDIHANCIALLRNSRGVNPIGGRKFDGPALQVGKDNLMVMLWRHPVFHGSITDFCQS